MTRRHLFFVALTIVVAAAIGVPVWLLTHGSPPGPPSVLDSTSAPTCAGGVCTAPGTVRWMRTLPGTYDLSEDLFPLWRHLTPAVAAKVNLRSTGYALPTASSSATVVGGVLVYQRGGLVQAIDAESGKLRWQTELRGSELMNVLGVAPVASGDRVAVSATPPGGGARIWELDLASGHVEASVPFSSARSVATLDASGVVVDLGDHQGKTGDRIEKLAWDSGAETWQATFSPVTQDASPDQEGPELIGHTLYQLDKAGTAIERIDLNSGRRLASLAAPKDLRGRGLRLYQAPFSGGAGSTSASQVLMATDPRTIARLDPATGRARWEVHGSFGIGGVLVGTDPVSSGPVGVYQEVGSKDTWRMTTLDLDSGKTQWTTAQSPAVADDYLGAPLSQENLSGLLYRSRMVTTSREVIQGVDQWARVEGVDARTGRTAWSGPWSSADMQVLGWSTTGPPMLVVEACAPAGVTDNNQTCTAGRVFGVNA